MEQIALSRKRLCLVCGLYKENPCVPAYPLSQQEQRSEKEIHPRDRLQSSVWFS
jgi:hypothetical protein